MRTFDDLSEGDQALYTAWVEIYKAIKTRFWSEDWESGMFDALEIIEQYLKDDALGFLAVDIPGEERVLIG